MKTPVFVLAGFALSMTACGAPDAQAPRVNVVPAEVRNFEVQIFERANMSFEETQLFLWKKDTTSRDVSRVIKNANNLSDLEERIFPMRSRENEIKEAFGQKAVDVDLDTLRQAENKLLEKRQLLTNSKAMLVEVEKLPKSVENDKRAEELRKEVAKYERMVVSSEKSFGSTFKIVEEAGLAAAYVEWKDLSRSLAELDETTTSYRNAIGESVWLFNSSPIRFRFRFRTNGMISAKISNWDLSNIDDPEMAEKGVPPEFSTEDSSIGNVTYSPFGGVFTFEVYTTRAVYWFKIARTDYHSVDGRVHYKGDIVRCSVENGFGRPMIVHERDYVKCGVDGAWVGNLPGKVGEPSMRRGVAKLVGQEDSKAQ